MRQNLRQAILQYANQQYLLQQKEHKENAKNCESVTAEAPLVVATKLAPVSPTPDTLIDHAIKGILDSPPTPWLKLHSESLVVDLGCGDGRWMVALHQTYQCRCIGVEFDTERIQLAQRNIQRLFANQGRTESSYNRDVETRIHVVNGDIFEFIDKEDVFQNADLVIVYLFREAMDRIGQLLIQGGFMSLSRINEARAAVKSDQLIGAGDEHTITDGKAQQNRVLSILSVGFSIPHLFPMWQNQVNGIRLYFYQLSKM
jgi:SAM-dependent methyltransferase